MATYRCIALSTADATRYRTARTDDFGYPIERLDRHETYPCRHCLCEASATEGMLLLSYQTPKPKSVYGHPTAIFLCARGCPRFAQVDRVPEIVSNRHVSFRSGSRRYLCGRSAAGVSAPKCLLSLAVQA